MEGSLASEKIVEALDAAEAPPERKRPLGNSLAHLRNNAVPAVLRRIERMRSREKGYARQKFPGLDAAAAGRHVRRLQGVTGRFAGATVRRLRKDCLFLSSGRG